MGYKRTILERRWKIERMQIGFNPNPNPNSKKPGGRDRGLPGAHLPLSPPPALLRCRVGRTTQAAGREVTLPHGLRLGLRGQGHRHKAARRRRAQLARQRGAPRRRRRFSSGCHGQPPLLLRRSAMMLGKRKEEGEGEPNLVQWLSSSPAPTATVAAAADAGST